jgi:hypothetical protein
MFQTLQLIALVIPASYFVYALRFTVQPARRRINRSR